ncbi:MAG: exodeoxyribonuclease V subunit gamma [Lachnospiraceae bacterium]|nr:exodeoxyribonuclease V subunit gamma [Lachnospiraceae bacterium]
MSLRFYFGPSDGELSKRIYEDVIVHSLEHPETNHLVIVPDQFTMQTQKELATMHPRGGILNIDVLSFGRLGHRILEEVDCREVPVLDDTGKSLVLQKVQGKLAGELPVLGSFLHKQGYVHEVKSAISEFMQYGLAPGDVQELIEYSKDRSALAGKLSDLKVLYEAFQAYIQDHFVTAEETLDVLCRNLERSKLIRNSVIVLDGYTGFTPIQYRLIRELALLAKEVSLTFVCGENENPYHLEGEQKLFYLTQKTVFDLEKLAKEAGIERNRAEDVFLPGNEEGAAALPFLKRHFLRYDKSVYEGETGAALRLFEATNPAQEVRQTALEIMRLIRKEGVAFRDFVIITGDLEGYAPYVESEFARLGIPSFIDRTRGITLNPLTEFILSALNLSLKNYSYEAVFHYMRSGMTGIPVDEIDRLENYVIELGIRGKKAYSERFARKTRMMKRDEVAGEAKLQAINDTRERFYAKVEILSDKKKDKAETYVNRLYEFLVGAEAEHKVLALSRQFEAQGEAARAKEYAQIYRLVMDLLNQIYQLLGEEEVSLQEFVDILTAGLGEIQVGTIPQSVDRILVGDMERTRFKPVKYLFFLGINDGNIPRNTLKGGIISDVEREFLTGSGRSLAPTPREQMFIQRFYLYLNISKPKEALYLSYARQGSDGKALRPAYLIESVKRLFPKLELEIPHNRPALEQLQAKSQGLELLADFLRDYAGGLLPKERGREFYTLYAAYEEAPEKEAYLGAAYSKQEDRKLLAQIAEQLYGKVLQNSVSRLETFAACAYKHFLQYGLSLKEREEFGFEAVDLGNVYHYVLDEFSESLKREKLTWFSFDEVFAKRVISEAMEKQAAEYGGSILRSNYRNEYQIKRMERILLRTVETLQNQLKKGTFTPREYEVGFSQMEDLGNAKMKLVGRIDRLDTAEDDGHVYVKVMDYKSGDRRFDLLATYYGLQMQLVVYMNAAMEKEKERHPEKEVVPAALLYYHLDDPMIEAKKELTDEELEKQIAVSLRAKGIVNETPEIVKLLDGEFTEKSDAIPVERNKNGSYSKNSSVLSREHMENLSAYVTEKLRSIGREVMDGNISLNPYEKGDDNACTFCPYGKVCGFDPSIPGCQKRVLEDLTDEEILRRMAERSSV